MIEGDISIEENATTRTLATVEGDIAIEGSEIHGFVKIMDGAIRISGTRINDSIIVMKKNKGADAKTEIVIGPGSKVGEILVKNRPGLVSIKIHNTADVENIIGIEEEAIEKF